MTSLFARCMAKKMRTGYTLWVLLTLGVSVVLSLSLSGAAAGQAEEQQVYLPLVQNQWLAPARMAFVPDGEF